MYNPNATRLRQIAANRSGARRAPAGKTARLCFVGDLMLGRRVSEKLCSTQPSEFWGDTLPLLNSADAVVANLESPITEHDGRWSRGWKAFRFAARPQASEILRAGNIRAVNLANNHILDCEEKGLDDTMRHLEESRICHVGAGMNLQDAWTPKILRAGGLAVGIIGITDNMKAFAAQQQRPGTSYLAINTEPATLALIGHLVAELQSVGADIVVLSTHWGPNLRPWPSSQFRQFAHAVIDAGVDMVHGHSAHLVQGVEAYGGGLILYDTGDFLDDYWVFPGIRIDYSFVFLIEYRATVRPRLHMVPVKLTPGRVSRATGDDFIRITRDMKRKSLRLGTILRSSQDGLELEFALPRRLAASLAAGSVGEPYLGSHNASFVERAEGAAAE